MSRTLPDGSVLPSNFTTSILPQAAAQMRRNSSLQIGMVIAVIYPESDRSITKTVIEYDVAVTNMDSSSGLNISKYRNCRLSDKFGMPNANETFVLSVGKQNGKGGFENGAIVIIECIGGNSDAGMAVIVGGISNFGEAKYSAEDGQFYDFNFNGINQNINKDGELTITFNSLIDLKGQKANEKAAGTQIKFDKDGRIKISDNEGQYWELDREAKTSTWSNGAESIVIDKQNKKVELKSSGEMTASATKDLSQSSDASMSMTAKENITASAKANLSLDAKGNMAQKSGGNWQVTTTGDVMVKAGGSAIIEGGNAAQLKGTVTQLGQGTMPVAIAGISICLGTGNLGAPVVSTVLTGSGTVLAGT